jgi:hypothetical protein
MARRYYVDQRNAAGKRITSVTYDRPEEALASFAAALAGAGHDDATVQAWLNSWATVLMSGGQGISALDPDLRGMIEIHIVTT